MLASTLTVATTAVLLFGVPATVRQVAETRRAMENRLELGALEIASVIDPTDDPVATDDAGYLANESRLHPSWSIAISTVGQPYMTIGPPPSGDISHRATSGATTVIVTDNSDDYANAVKRAIADVGLTALVALIAAVAFALWQARRFASPIQSLVAQASNIGTQSIELAERDRGIPEFNQLAEVLSENSARLAATLKREREFASNASHQLRTPLTALSIRLEEISGSDDIKEIHEEAAAGLDQVERLTGVVESLLARTRGTDQHRFSSIDISELTEKEAQEWEPAFARYGRRVEVDARPGLRAATDAVAVRQALDVLLDNALRHGSGTVRISLRPAPEHAVIVVGDHGQGIPPQVAHRIFERGVSGDGGTGLGLALARELVAAYNGRLELTHEQPAEFSIFLPIVAPKAKELTPEPIGGPA